MLLVFTFRVIWKKNWITWTWKPVEELIAYSPIYLQVNSETRWNACIFGLSFLSDLAKGRAEAPLAPIWVRQSTSSKVQFLS